ncbi:MAG TPA: hypothetical protein VK507_14825 [Iamia sp.]|nr:hypothetical protein [Iamia sp.]
MTTSRRPIRHIAALALAVGLGAIALAGCTPSELELEQRTTSSAYKVFTGRAAGDAPTCSLKLIGEEAGQDRYEGSCTVHGQSFRMTSFYDVSPSYSTAFVSAAVPRGGGKVFVHTCTFVKSGTKAWTLNSPCRTGEMPGF